MSDTDTTSGAAVTNATPASPPFSLTDPSTWASVIPSFDGGLQQIGADVYNDVSGSTSVLFNAAASATSAVVDPVEKATSNLFDNSEQVIEGAVGSVWGTAKSAVGGIFSLISTPIEWIIGIAIVLGLLYIAGPFLGPVVGSALQRK